MNEYKKNIIILQISKSRSKPTLKERHDSGVVDTSDAEEFKNTSDYELQYDTDENANINNPSTQHSATIIDSNGNTTEDQTSWNSNPAKSKTNFKQEKHKTTSFNIKHNTDLYNPDKLNKGQYLEVKFKNDLIFDLDM